MSIDNTTVEFDEWLDYANGEGTKMWQNTGTSAFFDIATARYLKDCFAGFVTAPVSSFKGVVLESKSRAIGGTIDELIAAKSYLEELSKKNELFLYQIVFLPAQPTYHKLDPETFEPSPLETPKMSNAAWKIRYAALNNENSTEI